MEKSKNKGNSARHTASGKRGFTLVELAIAMALLAILTAMIVSFSVLVNGYAKDSRAVTDYTEDCDAAKTAFTYYVRAHDESGFLMDPQAVSFESGTLRVGEEVLTTALDTLESITVDQSGKLIRVTLTPTNQEEYGEYVFVIALRFAAFVGEGS